MTPESRNRFAVLIERRLAGASSDAETAELSSMLEASAEARELYFRAVEFHLDLGALAGKEEVPAVRAPRISLQAVVSIAAGLLVAVAGFWYWNHRDPGPVAERTEVVRAPAIPNIKTAPSPPQVPTLPRPRHAALPPPTETLPPTERVSLPEELLREINDRFDALAPGYRGLIAPADRKRLEDLLQSRKGASEDLEWLRSRILGEALPSFERDAEQIAKVIDLEPQLKETASKDVVLFRDGRKIEGQIVEETEESVKIKSRFGSVKLAKQDVLRIERGAGASSDFSAQFTEALKATASERVEKLERVLAWCTEKNLKLQKEYTAYTILTLDASHEKARADVGLARPAPPK